MLISDESERVHASAVLNPQVQQINSATRVSYTMQAARTTHHRIRPLHNCPQDASQGTAQRQQHRWLRLRMNQLAVHDTGRRRNTLVTSTPASAAKNRATARLSAICLVKSQFYRNCRSFAQDTSQKRTWCCIPSIRRSVLKCILHQL
jgi:hypothetical protein